MDNTTKKIAAVVGAILFLLVCISSLFILLPRKAGTSYTAELYLHGTLVDSIDLNAVTEIRTIELSADGHTNVVEIRPGSIGIISADCPDQICVHQGFISDSALPITCLPHDVIIKVRPTEESELILTY